MLCIYGKLLEAVPGDGVCCEDLLGILNAHSTPNQDGYPSAVRWQDLFDDLRGRGLLRKPADEDDAVTVDPNWDTYAEVLLPDGKPAGIRTIWYDDTLCGVYVFEIPERHYRDILEDKLHKGTLLLPEGTKVTFRDADGNPEAFDLVAIRRETADGALLVRYRNDAHGEIEDYARDLSVADIYQILITLQD